MAADAPGPMTDLTYPLGTEDDLRDTAEQVESMGRRCLPLAVDGVPLDALALKLATDRNTLYKVMFDARRKIRAALVTKGYLQGSYRGSPMSAEDVRRALDQFLRTDPLDVGCERAIALLHAYVELAVAGEDPEARYPGVAAHLRACGPCGEDYEGLLLTIRETDAN